MFEGRTYKYGGYGGRSIRFADEDGGVATTAYSYKLSDEEREEMARRITAALNLTRYLSVNAIEHMMPLAPPSVLRRLREAGDRRAAGEGAAPLTRCAAGRDGECGHAQCPQLRDAEPAKSGRHCPLDSGSDE